MGEIPRPVVDISAQCACGGCGISVRGEVLTSMLCACTECQRASGAGHTAVAMVAENAVATTGPLKSFARAADSGATLTRYFCPDCATTLYSTSSRLEGKCLISPGTFANSDWFKPRQVIFNKSHTSWDSLPDDIPAYDTYKRT